MLENAIQGTLARFDRVSYSAAHKEEILQTAQTAPTGVQAYMTILVGGDKFHRIFTHYAEGWRDEHGEHHTAESAFGTLVETLLAGGADIRVHFC
jgi:hypothetical protein